MNQVIMMTNQLANRLHARSDVLIDKRDKMDMWEDREIIDNAIVDVDKAAKRLVGLINSGEKGGVVMSNETFDRETINGAMGYLIKHVLANVLELKRRRPDVEKKIKANVAIKLLQTGDEFLNVTNIILDSLNEGDDKNEKGFRA